MAEEQQQDEQGLGDVGNAPAENDDAPQLTETEQLAVEMGWRPQDQYDGDPTRWKPAKDFILAERDISRSMKQDVKRLRDQVDRMASASSKQTERMLRQQAEDLERKFAEAVENKDARGAAEAARGMRELESSARTEAPNPDNDFATENPWYRPGSDDEATAFAQVISQRELSKGIPFDRHKDTVVAAVRQRFPELFSDGQERQQQPRTPPQLHAPTTRQPTKRGKSFADLPADAKRAAETTARLAASRFGADPEKVKADYATDYFADQAA